VSTDPTRLEVAPLAAATRRVAVTGIVEASTYLVLVATALWRALLDGPDLAAVIGPVHGVAFLVYAGLVLLTRDEAGWGAKTTATMLIASVVPAGGFVVARRLRDGTLES
jgi:integral membrane protein